jgi:hypothetical protein
VDTESPEASVAWDVRARIWSMTAKEKVLERAPSWTEAQATAVLAVVEAQSELEAYFEAGAKLTPTELKAREDRRAEANARELIREEPW